MIVENVKNNSQMITISNNQYNSLNSNRLDNFIKEQVALTRSIYLDNIPDHELDTLEVIIKQIIAWGQDRSINKFVNLDYLIGICFKYNLGIETLQSDTRIGEIVSFPDRDEEKKLYLIHHYLKFEE
jgi:hypothetical protein